jgi:putative hydrolase of the HAD superfamily
LTAIIEMGWLSVLTRMTRCGKTKYIEAGKRFKQLLGEYKDPREIDRALYEVVTRNLPFYGYGSNSYTLSMIETAIAISNGRVSADVIQALLQLGRELLAYKVILFEHARNTVESLARDHNLMLVSKGDLVEQTDKIRRSGLAHLFKHIEIIPEKTSEIYQQILQSHGIPPDHFVMVGNSLKSEILPVVKIGGRAVFIPYPLTWAYERVDPQGHAYFEIEHLGQLPELIARLES